MNDPEPGPVALEAYEALAESYAALVDTKPHNAYYERPATLSLLGEVRGKRVLDAGCGPGAYSGRLVDGGAEVVAFDVSEKMVRLARERLGEKARVLRADLGRPLDFLEEESFDVVLSALALDYVEDWRSVFREFHRVLRRGGVFVFSIEHPFPKYADHAENDYFGTELVRMEWRGFGEPVNVPSYRRPGGDPDTAPRSGPRTGTPANGGFPKSGPRRVRKTSQVTRLSVRSSGKALVE